MNSILSVLLVAVCFSSALGLKDSLVTHLWGKFKKTHEKNYLSAEVESLRFAVFKKNLDIVQQHNADYDQGLFTYRLGLNSFADMTVEEFRAKMLGTKLKLRKSGSGSSGHFFSLPSNVKIPDFVDWREQGAVTPVKNQEQCGSCWAFSTTGALEGAHFRLTGQLVSLSEQQLVDCSGKYHNDGCNGGLMDNAFQYVKDIGGLDTEESYPYHAKQEKCHFSKKSIGTTCSGFVDIESGNEQSLSEALATVGPVSVAIDVTEEKFMLYKDGIFVDKTCKNGQDDLNHGVLIVGYGTNKTNDGTEQDFWIVKNSWSAKWGEGGFIRMARNLNNMCGISTSASYPLVKETSSFVQDDAVDNTDSESEIVKKLTV